MARKPVIEFFTEHEELLDYPPVPAGKMFPDWFKQMAPSIALPPGQKRFPFGLSDRLRISNVNATIKRCPGLLSYLAEGYLVPLWSDFVVQIRGDKLYVEASNDFGSVSLHSKHHQYDRMPLPDGYVPDSVKFVNPWKVKTPKGWSVMLSAPFYHLEDRYLVATGVVDSDVYHHIHVNTFFRKRDADHQLKLGTPFVHVMPFQRSATDLQVRHATDDDRKRMKRLDFRGKRFFGKNQSIREGMGEDD